MTTTLEYAAVPSRLQRWSRRLLAAGIVVVSNTTAAACTLAILLCAGIIAGVVLGIVSAFSGSYDSFLEVSVRMVLLAIFLAIVFALLAILLSAFIIIAGITADAIRRALRWPWWTGLPAVMCLSFFLCLIVNAIAGAGLFWTITSSALEAVIVTALFCIYWIPLGCTESILRLVRWAATKFLEGRHRCKLQISGQPLTPSALAAPKTSVSLSAPDPTPPLSAHLHPCSTKRASLRYRHE